MLLTEQEIMEKLGPRPWHEIQEEARSRAYKQKRLIGRLDPQRGSGRTTRTIIRALVSISLGRKVAFGGLDENDAWHVHTQAQRWCEQLGLDPKLINDKKSKLGEPEPELFVDHAVTDRLREQKQQGAATARCEWIAALQRLTPPQRLAELRQAIIDVMDIIEQSDVEDGAAAAFNALEAWL